MKPGMEPGMRLAEVLAAVTITGLILGAGASRAGACEATVHLKYNEPVALEGVLKSGTGHHEAQGDYPYVYLALEDGVCVDALKDDEFARSTLQPVSKLQVAGDAIEKELPVGKRVRVEGALFGAHTMWHAEDVLIDATTVEPK